MKKTVLRILALAIVAAVAFTVVHFAVQGNNSPTDTAFTFALEDGNAILTGSTDPLSGAVMLPETISGHTVVGIGENAFKDCTDVTAFFLPDSITSIGAYAFENCSGLLQMILPNGLVSIGEGAFWKCSGIVSMTVPASVTSIGSCAFYKCDAMESLIIAGANTPVKGTLNVALDIGQYIAVGNPAHHALDPITTTVYCYKDSVAHSDVMQDGFCDYAFLVNGASGNLTSYTVRYVDEAGADVAPAVTLNTQPVGISVAAVAKVSENEEVVYPDPGAQTIELSAAAADNEVTFVYPVRTYTITFDADGGEEKEPLVFATTDEAVLGATTRRGYSLLGWQVAEVSEDAHFNWGDTDTVYEATEAVTGKYGDVTLKAVWEADSVTVTFNAQGGTPDETEALVTFGETYGDLPEVTREGYTFNGWYTIDGTKIESSTTVTATEAHTLYASWTINKYDVTVTSGGNGTASADLTTDVEYGTTVTLTAVPDAGYEFVAWETEDVTIENDAFSMPDKAVSVNATFRATEYTISFDTNGGDAREPQRYKITDSFVLGGATRDGYTLNTWKVTTADGNWSRNAVYTAESTITGKYGNITMTANWNANSITVTYDGQGGTPNAESKNVTVGGTYGTLTGATREGYTFTGWYTSPADGTKIEPSTPVTLTSSHTIYAYWTINKYNITITNDGNGSADADMTTDVEYGKTVTLTASAKPGFAFAAWESSKVTVEDNTFTMPDKAVRVRATFSAVTYTVTFDAGEGDAKEALTYTTLDETALGSTTRDGYTFNGWQVSVPAASGDYNWGNTQKIYGADQTVRGKYGNVTLKALWEGNSVTVTYDAQGGSANAANKFVVYGSKYGTLARATREGYTFTGWYTAAENGTPVTADTEVTNASDHTLYAYWTINKHNVTVTTDGNGTASADLTTNVEYGKTVTLTAEANTGYTFLGWECTAAAITNNQFSMPDRAVSVRAMFVANDYRIAFDPNGGVNTMQTIDAQYDADVELPACTFERTGFEFIGWAQTSDAEAPEFEDGATVKNLTETLNETVTLYAVWKDVKVELIAKDGSTTVIDPENNFIYGLKFEITIDELLNDYLEIVGNGSIETETIQLGTGTVVELYNDNNGHELVDTYTLIIFGDVNGDGMLTSDDSSKARTLAARLGDDPSMFELSNPYAFAANVFVDDTVNSSDATLIRSLAARIIGIDQATRKTYALS